MKRDCQCNHQARNVSFDDTINLFKNTSSEMIRNVQNAIEILAGGQGDGQGSSFITKDVADELYLTKEEWGDFMNNYNSKLDVIIQKLDVIISNMSTGKKVRHITQRAYDYLDTHNALEEDKYVYLVDNNGVCRPDIDGDGVVSISDAQAISVAATTIGSGGDPGLTPWQYLCADINEDDAINSSDAAEALIFVTGVGAGDYKDTEEGWREFLIERGIRERGDD